MTTTIGARQAAAFRAMGEIEPMPYPIVINNFPFIWRYDVEACLDHLVAQGYRRIELLLTAPYCWPRSLQKDVRGRISERVRSGEIEIVALNPGGFDNNLASPAEEVRALAGGILAEVVDLAADWRAKGIVMSPGAGRPLLPPPITMLEGWSRAGIETLLARTEQSGVSLLLENIPYSFWPKADQIAGLIEAIDHPNLGAVYDVPNAVFAGESPDHGFERLKQHLRLVHFSDTPLSSWKHDRIGAGVVRFDEALQAMRRIGYEGDLVLEIIDADGDAAIAESVAAIRRLDPD